MKQIRGAIVANAAWIATSVWLALIVVRTLVFAQGNVHVFAALVGGQNFIGAATTAAAAVIVALLTWAAATLTFLAARGADLGLNASIRTKMWLGVAVSVVALVFVASVGLVLLTILLVIVAAVAAGIVGRRLRKQGASSGQPAKKVGARSIKQLVYSLALNYGVALAVLVCLGGAWIQPEVVESAGDARIVYYVSQDDGFTTFLTQRDRNLLLLRTDEIQSREACDLAAAHLLPSWLDDSLVRALHGRLAVCEDII